MAPSVSSRERLLAAIERRPVDHLPLCFEGICHGSLVFVDRRYPDAMERARYYLDLGVDHALHLNPPLFDWSEVTVRQREERLPDEPAPVLVKEYVTDRGVLRRVVRRTSDYPHTEVPVFSDHQVPAGRTREYLVAREADLPALAALLRPPAGEALAAFRQQARVARRFCDEHGMLLAAGYPGVGDPMVWMSGVEPLLLAAHDEPGFVDAYAAVVADWSRAIVGLLLDAGVDVVVRRGWYESTDFWSPELYRRHLFGPVAAEVRAAHQAGARVSYVMNSGSRPLWPLFGELGFDLLANVDPAAPGVDLAALRTAIGGRISVCGGVNNTHVLEQGSVAEVERAVRHAIDALGGHPGFVLAPGDSVGYAPGTDQAVAERNVQAMIATWRELTA